MASMKNQLVEWLRKVVRCLKVASYAISAITAALEALIAMLGPDFGFGAA
jgi:hypothetical protein